MIEKASAIPGRPARPRRIAMFVLAFIVVVTLVTGAAVTPYLFKGATLRNEIETQIRATTGLAVTSTGHTSFGLLPSPHVTMTGLHFSDPSGTLTIDAEGLEGNVRLLPLVVGRLELASATFYRPKLVIDLDAAGTAPDSMIGRAWHAATAPADEDQRLGIVTLVDGTAVLKGKGLSKPADLDDIDVTIDWPDLDSPATLTGSLTFQTIAADVAAWVAQPSGLMRGEASPIALRVHAAPLDLSANGDFSNTDTSTFRGHVSLTAPSLPGLLALGGIATSPIAAFANVALNSDATVAIDHAGRTNVDLPGLRLGLDGNTYEGTLAFQGGAKPALSGTLATDVLSLAPFLAREPKLTDAGQQWTRTNVVPDRANQIDLDLRVSASHLRAAAFTIDDAALSVMTRRDRTEVALVEGKAYGGDVKGRVSIGAGGGLLSLRGMGSLVGADAAALSWDAFGRQLAAGTLSGSANLETSGDSPAALMTHLQGWAKGRASDGELSGIDIGRGLHAIATKRVEAGLLALRHGRTPFTDLAFALRIADGVATVEEGSLQGAEATLTVTGDADIGRRQLDLHAVATAPAGTATDTKGPGLGVGIKGSFDQAVFTPELADLGGTTLK